MESGNSPLKPDDLHDSNTKQSFFISGTNSTVRDSASAMKHENDPEDQHGLAAALAGLRNCMNDPIARAQGWLRDNAKEMLSVSDTGVVVRENFVPMLILEATGDRSLVDFVEQCALLSDLSICIA